MKKSILILTFVVVFSFSTLADEGNSPIGSKSCPANQTCLVNTNQQETKDEGSIFNFIKELIAKIF